MFHFRCPIGGLCLRLLCSESLKLPFSWLWMCVLLPQNSHAPLLFDAPPSLFRILSDGRAALTVQASVILFPLSFHPTPPQCGKGCGRVRDRVGSLSLSFSLFFSLSFLCLSLAILPAHSLSLSLFLSLALSSLPLFLSHSLSLSPSTGRGEGAGCTEKAGLVLSHGNYGK